MADPLICLKSVRRDYPSGEGTITVLKNIDLSIEAGEMVAIVGASGSGKSTLMNILGCLDRPTSGSYIIRGRETGNLDADQLSELRRENLGFINRFGAIKLVISSFASRIRAPACRCRVRLK